MKNKKPLLTGSTHILPYENLDPKEFERLCLWLVTREGYKDAENLGAAGSEKGRDIVARKEGNLVAFQCKRVRTFGPQDALQETTKVLDLPDNDRPKELIFLVTSDVSVTTRDSARNACGEKMICNFWASTELDAKVKRYPEIVKEFFQISLESMLVDAGLLSLIQVLGKPEVKVAATKFKTDFDSTSNHIRIIHTYKRVHDLFQELENASNLIAREKNRLPEDETAWISIGKNEPVIKDAIEDIIKVVHQTDYLYEKAIWIEKIEIANNGLTTAIQKFDFIELDKASRILHSVISTQPSHINTKLVLTAELLRLDRIAGAIMSIYQEISDLNLDHKTVEDIGLSVDALNNLDGRLKTHVIHHNIMQEFDDELRLMEVETTRTERILSDSSIQSLKIINKRLNENFQTDWVLKLNSSYSRIMETYESNSVLKTITYFIRYRSQMSRCFKGIDDELLNLTEELKIIGERMNLLLEYLQ